MYMNSLCLYVCVCICIIACSFLGTYIPDLFLFYTYIYMYAQYKSVPNKSLMLLLSSFGPGWIVSSLLYVSVTSFSLVL